MRYVRNAYVEVRDSVYSEILLSPGLGRFVGRPGTFAVNIIARSKLCIITNLGIVRETERKRARTFGTISSKEPLNFP